MAPFKHKPLSATVEQFRLVKLRIRTDCISPTMVYEINHFSLGCPPPYRAISYTWGPPSPTRGILVNDAEIEIRDNLFQFLDVLSRMPDLGGYYWIDQLCIDQTNLKERNHQVKKMRDIFLSAVEVIIWLGPSDETTPLTLEMMKTSNVISSHQITNKSHNNNSFSLSDQELFAAAKLLSRPYFRRLWIVQEIMVAQQVMILCGTSTLSWPQLKNFYYRFFLGREFKFPGVQAAGRLLLKKSSMTRSSWLTLEDALRSFGTNECEEPRDKIYGLLGIVRAKDQLEIEYSESVETILQNTAKIVKQNLDEVSHKDETNNKDDQSKVDLVFGIGRSMGLNIVETALEMKRAGFSMKEMERAGFSLEKLKRAGFSAREIMRAGFSVEELKGAGFSMEEMERAGFPVEELKRAGFSVQEIKRAGFSAEELKRADFSAWEIMSADFSVEELKRAGFSAWEIMSADFSVEELKRAGFLAEKLKGAGFSARELKRAGFSAREIVRAGFLVQEIKTAGFSAEELKRAGFSAWEIMRAGFLVQEIKTAGFSAEELKGAGFSAWEVMRAGFLVQEMERAGFSAEELKRACFLAEEVKRGGFSAKNTSASVSDDD